MLAALALAAVLVCAPAARAAGDADAQLAAARAVEAFFAKLSARDAPGAMEFLAPDFLNKGSNAESIRKYIEVAEQRCSAADYACRVTAVDVSGDRAAVSVDGALTLTCNNGELVAKKPCAEEWDMLSGGILCLRAGQWKICGDQSAGLALSAFIQTDNPDQGELVAVLKDPAGAALSVDLSGPALAGAVPMSREPRRGSSAPPWSARAIVILSGISWPLTVQAAVTDAHGATATLSAAIPAPMLQFPRLLAPAPMQEAPLPVEFSWTPPDSPLFSGRAMVQVFSPGQTLATLETDQPRAVFNPETPPPPGPLFYRVSAFDTHGNILQSPMRAFRIPGPADPGPWFAFTDPAESYPATPDRKAWISGVLAASDTFFLNNTFANTIQFASRADLSPVGKYPYRFGVNSFCLLNGRLYMDNRLHSRIDRATLDGTLQGLWPLDTGAPWGALACDPGAGVIHVRNTTTGRLETYEPDASLVSSWQLPENTTAVAADGAGRIYFGDAAGRILQYTTDGAPLASWSPPPGFAPQNGVLVFDAGLRLEGIIDFNVFGQTAPARDAAPATLIATPSRVYVKYAAPGDCNVCGMLFDVDASGKLFYARMFR